MKHYYADVDNEDHTGQVVHCFTCEDCRDSFVCTHDLSMVRLAAELTPAQKTNAVRHTRCPDFK